MASMKKNILFCLVAGLIVLNLASNAHAADDEGKSSALMGPSVHLAIGIRSKKAPDLDTYYSTVGGIKLSPFSIAATNMYFSLLCPGLHYAGYGIFAPSISPVIFNHSVGVGFSADFFPVRPDRNGGPLGLSLNFDVVKIAQTVMAATGK